MKRNDRVRVRTVDADGIAEVHEGNVQWIGEGSVSVSVRNGAVIAVKEEDVEVLDDNEEA